MKDCHIQEAEEKDSSYLRKFAKISHILENRRKGFLLLEEIRGESLVIYEKAGEKDSSYFKKFVND